MIRRLLALLRRTPAPASEPAPFTIPPPVEPCSTMAAHRWEARWVEGEGVAYYTCIDCGETVESFE